MPANFYNLRRAAQLPYLQLHLIIGLLVSTVWGVIYLDLRSSHDEILADSRNDLNNLALAFAKEIESSVKMIDVTLLDLRERWHHDRDDFASALRIRQSYLEKELVLQVSVIDANGLLAFSSLDLSAPAIDFSDREHFSVHKTRSADELFISKPVQGRLSKRWSIQFTRPIYDKQKHFAGVLVISVPPEYFYRFYNSTTLPSNSFISLIRSSGEVLSTYPDPALMLGKSMPASPYLQAFAPESGTFQRKSPIDGIEHITAWRKVNRYDLIVTVGNSVEEILHPYEEKKYGYIAAGTALTLLLLIIGYLKQETIRHDRMVEQALQENEERWRLALEAAGDGVWDWNIRDNKVIFSEGWKHMLGYANDEIGNSLDEWKKRVHPDDMANVMHEIEEHFLGKKAAYSSEHRILCRNGSWKWILDRGMIIERDTEGVALRMVGTHIDISYKKEIEEMLRNLATTDSLTGLKNRRQFMENLENELARVKRYPDTKSCILMADLDHFKRINDTYGHAVGDAALKHFASMLVNCIRESDFAGRLGGEEFAILLTQTDLHQARQLSVSLCSRLRENPLTVAGRTICMTVSIGLTMLEVDDVDANQPMQRADAALYLAKGNGRDQVAELAA